MKIQPHKVSRDLSGYITYLYGPGKIGKTTFGSQMPGALLLAFEKGYNAIPNIQAQDVSTWSEMKQILRLNIMPIVKSKLAKKGKEPNKKKKIERKKIQA